VFVVYKTIDDTNDNDVHDLDHNSLRSAVHGTSAPIRPSCPETSPTVGVTTLTNMTNRADQFAIQRQISKLIWYTAGRRA
jgi:hypothetical protein